MLVKSSVRLDANLRRKLRRRAQKRGASVSAVVREAVELYLAFGTADLKTKTPEYLAYRCN